ncbi:MAG: hypothetical protein J6F30_08690 [Cellulosilyticum sp.]|nr:hypothetical protein [Cellulosilyticum sp.]
MKKDYIKLMYNNIPVAEFDDKFNVLQVYDYTRFNAIIDIDDFIIDRIPSSSRRDIDSLLFKWGLQEYNHYGIAIKTRLVNPMDSYWLKLSEEDNLDNLTKQLIQDTKITYSPSGNNVKYYTRKGDKFGIAKKRLSPVITDTESEVVCYRLSKLLEVNCCPVEQIDSNWTFSEYLYNFNKEVFKHVRQDMVNYTGDLFDDLLKTYPDLRDDIYKMILFDFITRQDDRHRSNIAILYTNEKRTLYPLYDNGRSLFFEDTEQFILEAIEDIQMYSTSFGEIGTYYDCIQEIKNPQQYINLDITKQQVLECFSGLNLPKYKVDGCVKWIQSCIDFLKSKSELDETVQGFK